MEKVLNIEGMSCQGCVRHVTKALEAVEGVKAVEVSLENKNATVSSDQEINTEVLVKAVENSGYKVV
ncbi:heavy-metal-associated domain-containing protein [Erysipelothrix sp. HDW6A]|uniref:heavy-metal-associated domain-containing protein n=1 Tax=Erysipelothrix sp. HDW6A TaxID=2714928 RepID=UPI001408C136|nr:heavy metal-associated domain-containing protein [Erysipelothrix sp. HDW6A]QIK57987.1 heavy-metal-associated domain-containing protein [Erysipelothrix sp. HDW6A]